jgi:hypothetical protein
MNALGSSDDYHDRRLAAASAEALGLGWDVTEALGGLVAAPHGTEVITAVTPDLLLMKLHRHTPLINADPRFSVASGVAAWYPDDGVGTGG